MISRRLRYLGHVRNFASECLQHSMEPRKASRPKPKIAENQEHAECVTCVGSALQPNFEIFRQARAVIGMGGESVGLRVWGWKNEFL